jgi:hypothetical protein
MSIVAPGRNRSQAERDCAQQHGYVFSTPSQEFLGIEPNSQSVKEAYQQCLSNKQGSEDTTPAPDSRAVQQAGISFQTIALGAGVALVLYLIYSRT